MILTVIVMALAVWRLSNMFADVDQEGLFNSLDKIRNFMGVKYDMRNKPYAEPGSIGAGLLCPYCSSIWFGIILTVLLIINQQLTFFVSLPFALSAMAIFVEEIRNGQK